MSGKDFVTRAEASYKDESGCFSVKEGNYKGQYCHLYARRLRDSRECLEETARLTWGEMFPIRHLSELQAGEKCAVVGTLFKQMVHKPNILKELSEEHHLQPQPFTTRFTDVTDELVLEDDIQRILLTGNVDVPFGVTGVVAVVLGIQDAASGKFVVEAISYRPLPMQEISPKLEEDKYVVLVSGIEVGGGKVTGGIDQHLFDLQLLVDTLNGSLGDSEIQEKMSKVCRVIVAGNSVSSSVVDKDAIAHGRGRKQQSRMEIKEDEKDAKDAVCKLDDFFFQIAINCEVDIMPGPNDPTTYVLPQKPLHPCLFPRSSPMSTFHLVPNPYKCEASGFQFLGTSGQPIWDIIRMTEYEDYLDVLEKTLIFGHLAPTAPDTLGCSPFKDVDPFILDYCPNIYFAGNSPKFQWKNIEGDLEQKVLLVAVPVFSKTRTAVLINLRTMQCEALSIGNE